MSDLKKCNSCKNWLSISENFDSRGSSYSSSVCLDCNSGFIHPLSNKKCSHCESILPISDFAPVGTTKTSTRCKSCLPPKRSPIPSTKSQLVTINQSLLNNNKILNQVLTHNDIISDNISTATTSVNKDINALIDSFNNQISALTDNFNKQLTNFINQNSTSNSQLEESYKIISNQLNDAHTKLDSQAATILDLRTSIISYQETISQQNTFLNSLENGTNKWSNSLNNILKSQQGQIRDDLREIYDKIVYTKKEITKMKKSFPINTSSSSNLSSLSPNSPFPS